MDTTTYLDPVCGAQVAAEGAISERYDGRTYHFCVRFCQQAFEQSPEQWLVRHRERLVSGTRLSIAA